MKRSCGITDNYLGALVELEIIIEGLLRVLESFRGGKLQTVCTAKKSLTTPKMTIKIKEEASEQFPSFTFVR